MTACAAGLPLLDAVVTQAWEVMLHRGAEPWTGPVGSGVFGVRADLAVRGTWTGTVRLWCEVGAATSITRALLEETSPHLDPDDVADAVGELANVLGGGFKGALEGHSSLGLPVVSAGGCPPLDGHLHRLLSWDGRPVAIVLLTTPAHAA